MNEPTRAEVPTVRRAHLDDLDGIADALAASFIDYPWTLWTVPGSDNDLSRLRDVQLAYLTTFALPHGAVYTTADRRSAAVFIPHRLLRQNGRPGLGSGCSTPAAKPACLRPPPTTMFDSMHGSASQQSQRYPR